MTKEAALASCPLFARISPPARADLADRALLRRYAKGATVFFQGDPGTCCYVIVSGSVKIAAVAGDGRDALLAILGSGDVFGELSLFDANPRSADATAFENTELLSIDRETIVDAIRAFPDIGVDLLEALAGRLRNTNAALQDIMCSDVTGRVARRLVQLATTHGIATEQGTAINLAVSQESLAGMVGASRESVNKALSHLTRRRLLTRTGRRYVIPDLAELQRSVV